MATPEAKVKRVCRAYLREIGCYVFSPVNMGYGKRTLDDLVCWRGRFLAIEYKKPVGGVTKAHQTNTAKDITAAGGVTFHVCSLDGLKDMFAVLEQGKL